MYATAKRLRHWILDIAGTGVMALALATSIVQAAETYEVVAPGLKLAIPSSWKQEDPSNNLRFAQFVIPAADGDTTGAEMVVSVAIGGSRKANVERWIAQFGAEGRKSTVTGGKSAQGEYVLVDIAGTYNQPVGPPIQGRTKAAPGYRMLGVIITGPKGNNFLKLTGPEKTVAAQAAALRHAIGAVAADEKPIELND